MNCPFCNATKEQLKVIDSRAAEAGLAIRRRRECLRCDKRFTTYERIELATPLTVIKRDKKRTPWSREKIVQGLQRACYKRPVAEAALQKLAEDVEDAAQKSFEREVPASWIGEQVMRGLRELDGVAYVRFASVYRQFTTAEELMGEMRELLEAGDRDPKQGDLFSVPRKRAKKDLP
jgi:transcriptional repressor NrdR